VILSILRLNIKSQLTAFVINTISSSQLSISCTGTRMDGTWPRVAGLHPPVASLHPQDTGHQSPVTGSGHQPPVSGAGHRSTDYRSSVTGLHSATTGSHSAIAGPPTVVTGLRERCLSLSNVAGEQLRGCIAPAVPAMHNLNPSACRSVPHLPAHHSFDTENDTDPAVEYLVAGSPIGDHSPVDPAILDYESESDDIGAELRLRWHRQ
jgi:hypothetical protein